MLVTSLAAAVNAATLPLLGWPFQSLHGCAESIVAVSVNVLFASGVNAASAHQKLEVGAGQSPVGRPSFGSSLPEGYGLPLPSPQGQHSHLCAVRLGEAIAAGVKPPLGESGGGAGDRTRCAHSQRGQFVFGKRAQTGTIRHTDAPA
jgi:hypothetical protein